MKLRGFLMSALFALAACQSTALPPPLNTAEERVKLAEINTQLALAYMRDGDNELALKKLQKAVEVDPKAFGAYNALGLLYSRLGEVKEAERAYSDALRIEPRNASALNNYGQFLCQQKRYKEGLRKFDEAIKNPLNRAPETAHTNAGTCAAQAGDMALAEQHFRSAIEINPQLPQALLAMADLSYNAANYLQARAYYQRYVATSTQSARTLWLGIRIERKLDDRNAVSSYALALKSKFPDSHEYGLFQQEKFD